MTLSRIGLSKFGEMLPLSRIGLSPLGCRLRTSDLLSGMTSGLGLLFLLTFLLGEIETSPLTRAQGSSLARPGGECDLSGNPRTLLLLLSDLSLTGWMGCLSAREGSTLSGTFGKARSGKSPPPPGLTGRPVPRPSPSPGVGVGDLILCPCPANAL